MEDDYHSDSKFPLIFIVIVGIILLVFLVIIIENNRNNAKSDLNPVTFKNQEENSQSTLGQSQEGVVYNLNGNRYLDSVACNTLNTRNWFTNPTTGGQGCICIPPFFGPNCERESYSNEYLAIGNPVKSEVRLLQRDTEIVDRLSFPFRSDNSLDQPSESNLQFLGGGTVPLERVQTLCTKLCDDDQQCVGVLWIAPKDGQLGTTERLGQCTKLAEVQVKTGQNIPFDPNVDSSLYMKKGYSPIFTDRVFIYSGELPLRYWLDSNDGFRNILTNSNLRFIYPSQLYLLNFVPTSQINNANLTGFYSDAPFEFNSLPNNIVKINPNVKEFNLPFSSPVYAFYI